MPAIQLIPGMNCFEKFPGTGLGQMINFHGTRMVVVVPDHNCDRCARDSVYPQFRRTSSQHAFACAPVLRRGCMHSPQFVSLMGTPSHLGADPQEGGRTTRRLGTLLKFRIIPSWCRLSEVPKLCPFTICTDESDPQGGSNCYCTPA